MIYFIRKSFLVCLLACGVVAMLASLSLSGAEPANAEEIAAEKDTEVSVYGRFWPRVTYKDAGGEGSTDITDALSRVGISATTQVSETLTAMIKGEWDVDIEANGDFGDARQAYVGLRSSDFGLVAIGKQWDPYYNVVAEVTDIFYHRSSPFGYDYEGPFRSNNLVRYSNSFMGLTIDSGLQVNGAPENGAGDKKFPDDHNFFRTNSDVSSDSDNVDAASIGVSYRMGNAYLGASYLRQNRDDKGIKRDSFGVGGSVNLTEALYLAATYQYIQDNSDMAGEDRDIYTLDVVGAISLGGGMKALAVFFAYDDDEPNANSDKLFGYNVTLIKEVHPSTDIFVEWLLRDYDHQDSENTVSLGFRYDFDVQIF